MQKHTNFRKLLQPIPRLHQLIKQIIILCRPRQKVIPTGQTQRDEIDQVMDQVVDAREVLQVGDICRQKLNKREDASPEFRPVIFYVIYFKIRVGLVNLQKKENHS